MILININYLFFFNIVSKYVVKEHTVIVNFTNALSFKGKWHVLAVERRQRPYNS